MNRIPKTMDFFSSSSSKKNKIKKFLNDDNLGYQIVCQKKKRTQKRGGENFKKKKRIFEKGKKNFGSFQMT